MRNSATEVIEHHQGTFIDRVCDDLQRLIDHNTITEADADQAVDKHGDDGLITSWMEWKEES